MISSNMNIEKLGHYLLKALDALMRWLMPTSTDVKKVHLEKSEKEYTLHDFVLDYFEEKGIKFEGFMLVGIRNSSGRNQDIINDYVGFVTPDELYLTEGTTEAGVYYTENKKDRNPQGTFYLREGYHKKIWALGLHRGYEALVNDWRKCLPTEGWRDANYNYVYDQEDMIVKGYYGINFHRMSAFALVDQIGKYSAGCQVVRSFQDFEYIIQKFKATDLDVVDYMLFNLEDLPENLRWRIV